MIVWTSAGDAKNCRESEPIREAMAVETELGLASTRGGFAVTQHLS